MTPTNARRLVLLVHACRGGARIPAVVVVPGGWEGLWVWLLFVVAGLGVVFVVIGGWDAPVCAHLPRAALCDDDGTPGLRFWWPFAVYAALRLFAIVYAAIEWTTGRLVGWWRGVESLAKIADAEDAMVHDVSARAARAALSEPDPHPEAARLTVVSNGD